MKKVRDLIKGKSIKIVYTKEEINSDIRYKILEDLIAEVEKIEFKEMNREIIYDLKKNGLY